MSHAAAPSESAGESFPCIDVHRTLSKDVCRMITQRPAVVIALHDDLFSGDRQRAVATQRNLLDLVDRAAEMLDARWRALRLSTGPLPTGGRVPTVLLDTLAKVEKFRHAASLHAVAAHTPFVCIVEDFNGGIFFIHRLAGSTESDLTEGGPPSATTSLCQPQVDDVKRFLADYAAGHAMRMKLSAPRPLGDRRPTTPPPLLDAVLCSFGDLVLANRRMDILVVYWSPHCPCCPIAIAVVAAFLELLRVATGPGRPELLQGVLYNVEENDYDAEVVPKVPTMHLYPSVHQDNHPTRRPLVVGVPPCDVEAFVDFILDNVGPNFAHEQISADAQRILAYGKTSASAAGGGVVCPEAACFPKSPGVASEAVLHKSTADAGGSMSPLPPMDLRGALKLALRRQLAPPCSASGDGVADIEGGGKRVRARDAA